MRTKICLPTPARIAHDPSHRSVWRDASGGIAIEYGLIGIFIACSILAGANLAGVKVQNMFQTLGSSL